MIASKREFTIGAVLMAGFVAVLTLFFLPLYGGKNGLNYMDDLYNSISKASANYLPQLEVQARKFEGRQISVTLVLADPRQAEETAPLFAKGGAAVEVAGSSLKVEGDLGQILANCLTDAGDMFENAGDRIREKYGTPERRVVYDWWSALKEAEKQLNKQKKFQEANFIGTVMKKGVECSYNYYTTEPKRITEKLGTVVFSLVFYVVYTVWYGFAIMYLFQGLGLKLEHG
jgi:hypothetical protein